jgi:hypothetical protein
MADQPPRHFALSRSIPPFRRRKLEEAGIRMIFYNDHDEIPDILRAIGGSRKKSA